MEASHLTNVLIRDTALYDSISFYLQAGETTEGIKKKFGGDVVKAIQFMRERSYEGMEIVERKPRPAVKQKEKPKLEPNILDPIHDPPPYTPEPKAKKKSPVKKGEKKPSAQEELF